MIYLINNYNNYLFPKYIGINNNDVVNCDWLIVWLTCRNLKPKSNDMIKAYRFITKRGQVIWHLSYFTDLINNYKIRDYISLPTCSQSFLQPISMLFSSVAFNLGFAFLYQSLSKYHWNFLNLFVDSFFLNLFSFCDHSDGLVGFFYSSSCFLLFTSLGFCFN